MWIAPWLIASALASVLPVAGPAGQLVLEAHHHVGVGRHGNGPVVVSIAGTRSVLVRGASTHLTWTLPEGSSALEVLDADGDDLDELFTILDGDVVAFDLSTGAEVFRSTPTRSGSKLDLIELDGVAPPELVVRASTLSLTTTVIHLEDGELWSVTAPLSTMLGDRNVRFLPMVHGDVNGDGTIDLVTADGIRDGITGQVHPSPYRAMDALGAGDVDGDGSAELVVTDGALESVARVDGTVLWSTDVTPLAQVAHVVDLNGDGTAEVLLSTNSDVSNHLTVFAGSSGRVLQDLPGENCARAWTIDGPRLACRGQSSGSPITLRVAGGGSTQLRHAASPILRAIDLDGDGSEEIVAVTSGVDVFSANGRRAGRPLSHTHEPVDFVDVDGDGTLELVSVGATVDTHRWHAQGRFVPDRRMLNRPLDTRKIAWFDLDDDGQPGMVFETGTELIHIDPRTGAQTVLDTGARFWGVDDLDGDGSAECWSMQFSMSIRESSGAVTQHVLPATMAAYVGSMNGHPTLFAQSASTLHAYRFDQGALTEIQQLPTRNAAPAFWVDGRLWQQDGGLLFAWNPIDNSTWTFAIGLDLESPPLVHAGALWVSGGGVLERWILP